MDVKLNISLKHFNPSAIGFYDYILQEKSASNSTIGHLSFPNTNELLQIIENEFEELHKPTTLAGILKVLHLTIQHNSPPTASISNIMKDLLDKNSSNEEDHIIALQILYQILTSLPKDYSIEHFQTSGLIEGVSKSNMEVDSLKLQTQLALCGSLLIEKFQINTLLETIWNQILTKKSHYLLVHYIDSLISKNRIYRCSEFWRVIETLLSAESRDERKLGTFLLRKVLKFLSTNPIDVRIDRFFNWSEKSSNEFLTSWLTYLTILENLEEKQSHLILPSLETLGSVTLGGNTPWIRVLLLQMLKHNNTLVLRWSVDYLYRNFTKLVLDNQILQEFLQATNNTWLFNENSTNAFTLPVLSMIDQKRFLEAFPKVPWKSVPMHVWLLRMKTAKWSGIDCKMLINIATRLRQLHNRYIRSNCRDIFTLIFQPSIDEMPLHDIMNFLDALYSSTDALSNKLLHTLVRQLQSSPSPFLSSNVATILMRQFIPSECESILMDTFDKVKVEDHKWFRILVRFNFVLSEQQQAFCKKHYDVHISDLDTLNQPLEEVMSEYVAKLSWDDISKAVVREATLDWVTCTRSCRDICVDNYEYFLDGGGLKTLINIVNPAVRSKLVPVMLDRFMAELRILVKKMVDTELLVWYIIKGCAEDQPELLYKYVNEILDIDVTNNRLTLNVFRSVLSFSDHSKEEARQLLIRGLLFGEPLNGDSRVEHDYVIREKLSKDLIDDSTYEVRQTCIRFLNRLDKASKELVTTELIAQSKAMSIRKPRYFENSKHHRLKLRIAQALAAININTPTWNDYYLFAILHENNQTNVTYIYEFLVATTISELDLMKQMENLKNLSSSCQVSMFAISYLFTLHHGSSEEFIHHLITLLLPWTMGTNFSTRLYAQITIHHLLQQNQINSFDYLKTTIEESLKESPNAFEKLNTDVRYNFPDDFDFLDTDPILYVTTVAEDEHPSSKLEDCGDYKSLRAARDLNLSKQKSVKENANETLLSKPIIEDVQRKMNPDEHSSGPKEARTDMVVVASLIDKLPNLGGIARTCEVLGVKNLVMDSIKHAQNKEFKNLSMTAENWINITEVKPNALQVFLISKKTEGYKIVGAEQTAKSVNFMEFKFPNKCILLLGHEKEGIPADLIAFLDYAVEIPQFGMVRSLNVHVTGALFMYEYSKQQLYNLKVD